MAYYTRAPSCELVVTKASVAIAGPFESLAGQVAIPMEIYNGGAGYKYILFGRAKGQMDVRQLDFSDYASGVASDIEWDTDDVIPGLDAPYFNVTIKYGGNPVLVFPVCTETEQGIGFTTKASSVFAVINTSFLIWDDAYGASSA